MKSQVWKKKGLVFRPDKSLVWQNSHAALPTVLDLGGSLYRVYFTSRDKSNKTYVGFFEMDLTDINSPKIYYTSKVPVLSPGSLGYFDCFGVQCTSVVRINGLIYMYYLGWTKGLPEPLFYSSIGLAVSHDDGISFEKWSDAPIMERSRYDPWMVSGGTVVVNNDKWKMLYISGEKFEIDEVGVRSCYNIKYAESENGIVWKREGHICLPLRGGETNISRPSILFEDETFKTWYPYKANDQGYRIGYAESTNCRDWIRKDELAGIHVSESGWDSQALDKVFVFDVKGTKIMLYNGNNFGLEGIGLAIYGQD